MGTVLQPRDWLSDRIREAPSTSFHRRKTNRRPEKKRPTPPPSYAFSATVSIPIKTKRSSLDDLRSAMSGSGGPVMVLRRGESLDSKKLYYGKAMKAFDGEEMLRSGFQTPDMYAGSAFSLSPASSALPLPSFSRKIPVAASSSSVSVSVDDSATRYLRQLLRLD